MDELKEIITDLVKTNKYSMSLTKLMTEYFDRTQKHLYLEVIHLGLDSIPHLLTFFDGFDLKMENFGTFDLHIRPKDEPEQELFGLGIKIERPESSSATNSNTVIRSYSTVKEDDQPEQFTPRSYTNYNEATPSTTTPNKRQKKFRRRLNRSTPPPYRPSSQNRSRNAGTPNFLSQYYQSYSNLAPFDYRSWTGGQRYFNDTDNNHESSSTTQPYYMSSYSNPWSVSVLPFSYNPNNSQSSHWNSSDQQNKRRNRF